MNVNISQLHVLKNMYPCTMKFWEKEANAISHFIFHSFCHSWLARSCATVITGICHSVSWIRKEWKTKWIASKYNNFVNSINVQKRLPTAVPFPLLYEVIQACPLFLTFILISQCAAAERLHLSSTLQPVQVFHPCILLKLMLQVPLCLATFLVALQLF